jgi:hypothetical protein
MTTFQNKVKALRAHHEELLSRKNEPALINILFPNINLFS